MTALNERLELLLFDVGPWKVGIDSTQIEQLQDHTQYPAERSLASLLGVPDTPDAPTMSPSSRTLILRQGKRRWRLRVSARQQPQTLYREQLQPVPRLLRQLDAPAWWLGTAWLQGQLILLVDPLLALSHDDQPTSTPT